MAFDRSEIKGRTDVSVPIMVVDSGDGTPETGYTDASSGIDLWYRREGGLEVSITEAALAAWNSAHADGGVEHGSDGRGRLDLPDAACAIGTDGATYVEYGGTITGMVVIGGTIKLLDPVNEVFTSQTIGSTGNTATTVHVPTWGYGDDEIAELLVAFKDVSEDEWHIRWITGWANMTNLATLSAALPVTPENAVDQICLLGGSRETLALQATVAAISTVLGTQSTVAQTGDPDTGTAIVAYIKQLVNLLAGTDGIATMPAGANPANGVNLFEMLRALMGATFDTATDSAEATANALETVDGIVDAILVDTGTALPALIGAPSTDLATDIAAVAAAVWNRNIDNNGAGGARVMFEAMQALRNRVAIAGGTMTVYEDDDATSSWTSAITTAAGDPITESNPA